MLEAPEPGGLPASSERWDPGDPEAQTKPRAGTREGDGRGTREILAWERAVGQLEAGA